MVTLPVSCSTPFFIDIQLNLFNKFFLALSDAIRTSLGPRGMDKMVKYIKLFIILITDRDNFPLSLKLIFKKM